MVFSLILIVVVFSTFFSLSETSTLLPSPPVVAQTLCGNQQNRNLIFELQEMKLKVSRLESKLEESMRSLNEKVLYLEDCTRRIDDMSHKIHSLQMVLLEVKRHSARADERVSSLEEEVQLLWAASRNNNFHNHVLGLKAQGAEERLEVIKKQVEQIGDIVTEHWIQIRHLEQALLEVEVRALRVRRQSGFTRCTFLRLIKNFNGNLQKVIAMPDSCLFNKKSLLKFYGSQALHHLRKIFSVAKQYHHELQYLVRQEMKRNALTAALAKDEVVFFVASALITFPLMGAWILLSSQFY